MNRPLRSLLTGLIDYAGLFPPASLPMAEAVEEYFGVAASREAWMLSHFVVPASRLDELEGCLGGRTLSVAAIVADAGELAPLAEFARRSGCPVAAIETRLEPEALGSPPGGCALFVEAAADFGALAAGGAGIKLRCGGVEASMVPPVAEVAEVIAEAARVPGLRMKFTAGLHHPLRHHNRGLGAPMHGFINVFAAALLAREHRLDPGPVAAILELGSADDFQFVDGSLAAGGHVISAARIAALRRDFAISFGSCSFAEPLQDLEALGWMP